MANEVVSFWLAVERYENWLADRDHGFTRYGIAPKKVALASRAKTGDLIVTYVSSRRSAIADLREISADGVHKIERLSGYDEPFQLAILTKPLTILPESKWIPFDNLVDQLVFVRGTQKWGNLLRNSLRQLAPSDGTCIRSAIDARQLVE